MSKPETVPLSSDFEPDTARSLVRRPLVPIIILGVLCLILFGVTIGLAVRVSQLNDEKASEAASCPTTQAAQVTTDFPFQYPLPPWNISSQLNRSLSFTVTEGTWVNLDVSPDNNELVFDLLGDLYTMSLNPPGPSRLLRGGAATDRIPRYSPDGQHILFTSDEGGCDNIWVMNKNSGVSWALTDDAFRYITDGVWSPNGTVVIATKWYTGTRSLGGGELWSYPFNPTFHQPTVNGGGFRVVGRTGITDQIGPQEAEFSPDGVYIYYCKDTMDSVVWNYNNNPHQGIYTIFRFNVNTRGTETVTSGAGGASRPVLSPDGLKLAFIRRYYFNSSLVIRDLQTGNEVFVYDGLTKDQQTCFPPHGTYPKFAFTRDNKNVIIWSKGQILSIDVTTGQATTLPFQVSVNLQVAPTVHPQQQIETTNFDVKVANWPSVASLNGGVLAAYNAIGKAWVKQLGGVTAPTPLTNQFSSSYQFYPTYAPSEASGNVFALVVWDDRALSTLVAFQNPNQYTNVTADPGRYVEPQFCPTQSSYLVYRRLGGDSLSGSTYGLRSGIYLAVKNATNQWTSTLISSSGNKPHWSSDCQQLYVTRGGYPNVTLTQISIGTERTGRKETLVASTQYGNFFRISPDAKWVAFIEFRQVYVTPLTDVTWPLTLSARPGLTPKKYYRLSTYGAHWIEWDTSDTANHLVRYTHGAKMYEVDVDEIDRLCQTNDLSCVENHRKLYDLSFNSPVDIVNTTYVCFDNATVVTMTNRESSVISPGRVVVNGHLIEAVGGTDGPCPEQSQVMDLQGGVIMPGIIDAHAHWSGSNTMYVQQDWEFIVSLAFGTTTMHNPSLDTVFGFTDRELVLGGKKLAPRLFSTGTILYGAMGDYHCEVETVNDGLTELLYLKEYGAWSVKSYNIPCRSSRQQVLEAARMTNMAVVPEGGMSWYWNLNQIVDGHTTIEHNLPIQPFYDDVIQLVIGAGTALTPTFIVNYGDLNGEIYWYENENVWENERLMRFSRESDIRSRSVRRLKADDRDYFHFDTAKTAAAVFNAGGSIQTGAHGNLPGLGIHWEIGMLGQGGLTPHEALYSATASGAITLGLDDYLGTIEEGKLADLIVYDPSSNPLENLLNSREVKYVMKNGYLYDAETMAQILPFAMELPQGPSLNNPHLNTQ